MRLVHFKDLQIKARMPLENDFFCSETIHGIVLTTATSA